MKEYRNLFLENERLDNEVKSLRRENADLLKRADDLEKELTEFKKSYEQLEFILRDKLIT